ncbi:UNVERIFIED_CONTAM: hypothetical protein FKN15_041076 [Acipenser sinensis]
MYGQLSLEQIQDGACLTPHLLRIQTFPENVTDRFFLSTLLSRASGRPPQITCMHHRSNWQYIVGYQPGQISMLVHQGRMARVLPHFWRLV